MKNSTALILLLISAGLFYAVTNPQYKKIKELREAHQSYTDILNNVSDLAIKRDDLLTKYRNIPKENVDNLTKVLPDNVDIVRLSMDFDSIASRYGISIKGIQVDTNKTDNNRGIIVNPSEEVYGKSTISFSFISSYDNFKKFLNDVENSLRIVNVKSIDFQSSDNGLYQYQVSIETYWLK